MKHECKRACNGNTNKKRNETESMAWFIKLRVLSVFVASIAAACSALGADAPLKGLESDNMALVVAKAYYFFAVISFAILYLLRNVFYTG